MIQQFHFWIFIQRKRNHYIEEISAPLTFIAELFTIARTWKNPKCLLTDEWIKQFDTHTHTHKHEHYASIKKKEILLLAIILLDFFLRLQSFLSLIFHA